MTEYVIEAEGLTKRFGDFTAVQGLDMQIQRGQVHGFLGPNGSGKTTAIRMMCGLLDISAGNVRVLGLKIPEYAEEVRDQVGYMTQRFSHYQDMTVRENLMFLADIRGMPRKQRTARVDEVLGEYNLAQITGRLAGDLSGGQKRRLSLAGAVLTRPQLLMLDEPTSEVDPNTRRDMWSRFFRLAAEGTSILVSTHLMDEAERCHRLTILNQGEKVADGTTDELKQRLPQSVVNIHGADVSGLADSLSDDDQILAATQSGLSLRVLVDRNVEDPVGYVRSRVGTQYQLAQIEAAIEDVFVAATMDTSDA